MIRKMARHGCILNADSIENLSLAITINNVGATFELGELFEPHTGTRWIASPVSGRQSPGLRFAQSSCKTFMTSVVFRKDPIERVIRTVGMDPVYPLRSLQFLLGGSHWMKLFPAADLIMSYSVNDWETA